ncbi:MAG TPA: ABC transporter ATP-binding protein [Acidobacteriaceae bacterium]|jgi:ABC-type multidrug transport system ATPase subunit|nr:ABC transporter ATP-binding protein [Acidobacteriaceae bacterium]
MPSSHSSLPAVELTHVSRHFGGFAALQEVSLRVQPGASVLLLGENGAGKSTLLRLLAGLIPPTSGTVAVFGSSPHEQRDRLALMSHAPMLYDELTGLENLRYFAALYASPGRHLNPEQALREVDLDPNLRRHVRDYSQGMRQRASLARVLMLEPDLLLLDEPFSNLDAASARTMVSRLGSFLSEPGRDGLPRTLFLTTHQAELARPLASATLLLRGGRIERQDTPHAPSASGPSEPVSYSS